MKINILFITLFFALMFLSCIGNAQNIKRFDISGYNIKMLDNRTNTVSIVNSDTINCEIEIDSIQKEIRVLKDDVVVDFFQIAEEETFIIELGAPKGVKYHCIGIDHRLVEVLVPYQYAFGKITPIRITIVKQFLFTKFLYNFMVVIKLND